MSIEHSKWEELRDKRNIISLRTERRATATGVWRPTGWLR